MSENVRKLSKMQSDIQYIPDHLQSLPLESFVTRKECEQFPQQCANGSTFSQRYSAINQVYARTNVWMCVFMAMDKAMESLAHPPPKLSIRVAIVTMHVLINKGHGMACTGRM